MRRYQFVLIIVLLLRSTWATSAPAAEPITIGLGIAQSGQLAANGKAALAGMKIWEDDVNAKGGLLGRPVKLVYYDNQSNPANVPALYTKLLEVDKVDLIVSGYATNMIAAALPVAIQKKKLLIGLFGTAVNRRISPPRLFFHECERARRETRGDCGTVRHSCSANTQTADGGNPRR